MGSNRTPRGQVSAAQTVLFMIFGRTDLRIGVSGAKFGAEADFEVHLALALQKPGQKCEKVIFWIEILVFRNFREVLDERKANGP